eukprot:TRINITY_DN11441_c0_g1_i1.p1 TRINITY_DN11441_c0_g1~~TRINITY_DN11441_c0_g1_i1.p1  ORF type:complete len:220 (+),score=41.26 TRINITY_DN11441_c0_g1_i1:84-743(+)
MDAEDAHSQRDAFPTTESTIRKAKRQRSSRVTTSRANPIDPTDDNDGQFALESQETPKSRRPPRARKSPTESCGIIKAKRANSRAKKSAALSQETIQTVDPFILERITPPVHTVELDDSSESGSDVEVLAVREADISDELEYVGRKSPEPKGEAVVKTIKLVDALTCSVCFSKLSLPTSTSCGHIFCYACIKRSVEAFGTCPICREKQTPDSIHRIFFS